MHTGRIEEHLRFANVDLELESEGDLQLLIDELGSDVNVQFHGKLKSNNNFASLSLSHLKGGPYGDADTTVSAICDLLDGLSQNSKDIWSGCCVKEFDIGFESGVDGAQLESRLENNTLRRVVELGATMEITIYPVPKDY